MHARVVEMRAKRPTTTVSWTLRDRATYMLRVQADPVNAQPLRRMNAQFAWGWATATVLFALMGALAVHIHPGPMLQGATTVQACGILALFVGFLACGVWA
jgi:hypothetical protein